MKKIILFGDSITEGKNVKTPYAKILVERLKKHIIINKGVTGNTILDAYNRVEKDVLRENPDIVIIFFGVNDGQVRAKLIEKALNNPLRQKKEPLRKLRLLKLRLFGGSTKVSEEEFELHLSKIIEMINKKTNAQIYHITIPNISNKYFPQTNKKYNNFNAIVYNVARKYNTKVIDISEIFTSDEALLSDGKHPSEKSHALIAEKIIAALEQ